MPGKKAPLESIVKDIIEKWKKEKKEKAVDILGAWKKAAGARAFKHSRPVRIEKGRLLVNTSDSSWLYELTLKKEDILDKLNRRLKGRLKGRRVREIRFRIGDVG